MILLARKLDNDDNVYFGALDAVVRRNAYGRQLGSFAATADFGSSSGDSAVVVAPGEHVPQDAPADIVLKDFPLVFIRGPFVAEVGPAATVETSVDGNVVGLAPRQDPRHGVPSRAHRRHPHSRALPESLDSGSSRTSCDFRPFRSSVSERGIRSVWFPTLFRSCLAIFMRFGRS